MTKRDDGGPAFPGFGQVFTTDAQGRCGPQSMWGLDGPQGMSLRDWFAGQALSGLFASGIEAHYAATEGESRDEWQARIDKGWAAYCYEMADAMLAERARAHPSEE